MSDDLVYAVAVGTQPLMWVVHCEVCNDEFGSPTDDDALLELVETAHKKTHVLTD